MLRSRCGVPSLSGPAHWRAESQSCWFPIVRSLGRFRFVVNITECEELLPSVASPAILDGQTLGFQAVEHYLVSAVPNINPNPLSAQPFRRDGSGSAPAERV